MTSLENFRRTFLYENEVEDSIRKFVSERIDSMMELFLKKKESRAKYLGSVFDIGRTNRNETWLQYEDRFNYYNIVAYDAELL